MSSIRLHPKHGLNPTMPVCFYCRKDTGEVALLGAAYKGEAPRRLILDKQPCEWCQANMKLGIILVACHNGTEADPQPAGQYAVITEGAATRMFRPAAMLEQVLRQRMAFLDTETWTLLGLDTAVANAPEEGRSA